MSRSAMLHALLTEERKYASNKAITNNSSEKLNNIEINLSLKTKTANLHGKPG